MARIGKWGIELGGEQVGILVGGRRRQIPTCGRIARTVVRVMMLVRVLVIFNGLGINGLRRDRGRHGEIVLRPAVFRSVVLVFVVLMWLSDLRSREFVDNRSAGGRRFE